MYYEMDFQLRNDLMKSGAFDETGRLYTLLLSGTDYVFHLHERIWLIPIDSGGTFVYQKVNFDLLYESLSSEIKEKLVYHLDLFI